LAFGDSSYGNFCGHGRRLDRRMEELDAVRLAPRTDCEPDYETEAGAWLDQVLTALRSTGRPGSGQPAPAPVPAAPAVPRPGRPAPATARLAGNRLLSRPGGAKEVRRFTFDTRDSDTPLVYEAGDALAVHPLNSLDLVTEWLAVTGLDADATVQVNGAGEVPFAEALLRHLDITRITPGLLRLAADRARDPRELRKLRKLRKLLRPGNEDQLAQWSWGRQAVDVAAEFGVRAGPQEWADVLGRLQPRLFSVSSSPLTDPCLVSLTVSVVRYQNPGGRPRQGVCSPFLADAEPGTLVPVRVQRAPHFRPPADPATPCGTAIRAGCGGLPCCRRSLAAPTTGSRCRRIWTAPPRLTLMSSLRGATTRPGTRCAWTRW
jgi:sulfite reductase (NADPH) flavoprotein alpha-component